MCGICGVWRADVAPPFSADDHELLTPMLAAIAHRGPDATGMWRDGAQRAFFGHARLAVRDLSPAGAQPMQSRSGQTVIVYNGEVYSHGVLQARLAERGFLPTGTSDTELILEHCEAFGVDATLPLLNGMFAFALLNLASGSVTLVRDRLGIKPLYYSYRDGRLIFGSELASVVTGLPQHPKVSRSAVAELLMRGAIPHPLTIYEDVQQLPPGHVLTVQATGESSMRRFWSLSQHLMNVGEQLPDHLLVADADRRLGLAVERCLVSDVPVGVLLSGGVDSSLVTAMATRVAQEPVRTFSIGFDDVRYDESAHAAAIAAHLGTRHTSLNIGAGDVMAVVDDLPSVYAEPFADSSQLPTLVLSRLVRQHLPVVLTGDGGDESFAGYDRHVAGGQLMQRADCLPSAVVARGARAMQDLPVGWLAAVAGTTRLRVNPRAFDGKTKRLADAFLSLDDPWAAYQALAGHSCNSGELVIGADSAVRPSREDLQIAMQLRWQERIQFFDSITYLPDDLLVKVDRATMSVGLEARVPLLDYEIVEWAWSLPRAAKVRDSRGKWILREVLAQYVPRAMLDRPKQGFAVPLDEWLRDPLRSWADELLCASDLRRQGLLHVDRIATLWKEHQAGAAHGGRLWSVLMLQAWLRANPAALG